MGTEIAFALGILFVCGGFYERSQMRYRPDTAISKNFDANLFITMGVIIVSTAVYSLFS